jgi:hypothetical protein
MTRRLANQNSTLHIVGYRTRWLPGGGRLNCLSPLNGVFGVLQEKLDATLDAIQFVEGLLQGLARFRGQETSEFFLALDQLLLEAAYKSAAFLNLESGPGGLGQTRLSVLVAHHFGGVGA